MCHTALNHTIQIFPRKHCILLSTHALLDYCVLVDVNRRWLRANGLCEYCINDWTATLANLNFYNICYRLFY